MSYLRPSVIDFNLIYDPKDPRLGFLRSKLEDSDFVFIGYPDDRGIKANGGRVGAALAPDAIRKHLFKTTPALGKNPVSFYDSGNFVCDKSLEEAQLQLIEQLDQFYTKSKKVISVGGGHDYGFPDCAAFLKASKKLSPDNRPLIINFDAHLDVRPLNKGVTSGTPFFQLLESYKDFDLIEIGMQPQCNSTEHLNWALKSGVNVITTNTWRSSGSSLLDHFNKRFSMDTYKNRNCFLSVDIDFFANHIAPGCSQSWPSGADVNDFFPLFDFLLLQLNVMGIGIYEVSPPLDIDDRTSKLAALIAHRYLYHEF